mmetsp:Transcript_24304/g.81951  ORF Transcript_24304/g.81951 Transcript_24304/m.81951 type:complete len:245 (+) Transcript_24304:1702-2436(+)
MRAGSSEAHSSRDEIRGGHTLFWDQQITCQKLVDQVVKVVHAGHACNATLAADVHGRGACVSFRHLVVPVLENKWVDVVRRLVKGRARRSRLNGRRKSVRLRRRTLDGGSTGRSDRCSTRSIARRKSVRLRCRTLGGGSTGRSDRCSTRSNVRRQSRRQFFLKRVNRSTFSTSREKYAIRSSRSGTRGRRRRSCGESVRRKNLARNRWGIHTSRPMLVALLDCINLVGLCLCGCGCDDDARDLG